MGGRGRGGEEVVTVRTHIAFQRFCREVGEIDTHRVSVGGFFFPKAPTSRAGVIIWGLDP